MSHPQPPFTLVEFGSVSKRLMREPCVSSRAHPRSGSVQTSPSSTPMSGRRGRQLPQLPAKGTLDRSKSGTHSFFLWLSWSCVLEELMWFAWTVLWLRWRACFSKLKSLGFFGLGVTIIIYWCCRLVHVITHDSFPWRKAVLSFVEFSMFIIYFIILVSVVISTCLY